MGGEDKAGTAAVGVTAVVIAITAAAATTATIPKTIGMNTMEAGGG
jgi:hypothetical protein